MNDLCYELHELMKLDGFEPPVIGCDWVEALGIILDYTKWLRAQTGLKKLDTVD